MLCLDAGRVGIAALALEMHHRAIHEGALQERVLRGVEDTGVVSPPHGQLVQVHLCIWRCLGGAWCL